MVIFCPFKNIYFFQTTEDQLAKAGADSEQAIMTKLEEFQKMQAAQLEQMQRQFEEFKEHSMITKKVTAPDRYKLHLAEIHSTKLI